MHSRQEAALGCQSPFPKFFDVRGEVYMNKKDFAKHNSEMLKHGQETFANPRNAAAGSLRQKDPSITATRPLRFMAHSFGVARDRRGSITSAVSEATVRPRPAALTGAVASTFRSRRMPRSRVRSRSTTRRRRERSTSSTRDSAPRPT